MPDGAEPVPPPPTQWLSGAEQAAWRTSLSAVQLLNSAVDNQLQRDSGLSHADYEILVRLSEEPEHALRMSELADRALFSRSRLSHAVGRLEKSGLVRREPYPDDRRGLCAVLTERGLQTLEAAAPGHVADSAPGTLRATHRPADRAAHGHRAGGHRRCQCTAGCWIG